MEAFKNQACKQGYDEVTIKDIKGIMGCTEQTFANICVILNVSNQYNVKYAKIL